MIEAGDNYMRFYMNGGRVMTVDSNTKLLLHCDGANASQDFVDDGNTGHTVTANGTVQHTTSIKKFGSTSALMPGASGDYLSVGNHADWDILSQTSAMVEGWFRLTNLTADTYLISQYEDSDNYWALWFDATGTNVGYWKFVVKSLGSEIISATSLLTAINRDAYNWYWVALCKVSDAYGIYVNGGQVAYTSDADSDTFTGPLNIGCLTSGTGHLEGQLDEVRVYHGNPFSASPNIGNSDAITPPSLPYPYVGTGGGATSYELATTYDEEELELLDWVQSADTLYITSPDRCPRKLTRTDHDSWSIADLGFDANNWPPFLDKNITATEITPSATTGSITLTASASLFNSDMV
ncbi:MAG: hypothetical protein GWN94_18440, partial [Phycisphaerae bacterium]|nr:hypothetical protein [Phycisphaerae bacterium]NIS53056.1 hypothetical protein [Phycisphaerae bacterium]